MLLDSDEKKVILALEGEDGETEPYELIDLVEYLGRTFGIFLPEGQEEGEVAILELVGEDDERAENYAPVDDEGLEQATFDLFQAKNFDRFDFGDSQFGTDGSLF